MQPIILVPKVVALDRFHCISHWVYNYGITFCILIHYVYCYPDTETNVQSGPMKSTVQFAIRFEAGTLIEALKVFAVCTY